MIALAVMVPERTVIALCFLCIVAGLIVGLCLRR